MFAIWQVLGLSPIGHLRSEVARRLLRTPFAQSHQGAFPRAWAVQTRERAEGAPEVLCNVARGAPGLRRAAPPALYPRTPGARPHRALDFHPFKIKNFSDLKPDFV
jgi:hypothetical protein